MFIEGANGDHWNLHLCVNYRQDDKGVYRLVFPVDGGVVKVRPNHRQYRDIVRYLNEHTTTGAEATPTA